MEQRSRRNLSGGGGAGMEMFCSLIEQGVPQVCTPARTPQIVHFKQAVYCTDLILQ